MCKVGRLSHRGRYDANKVIITYVKWQTELAVIVLCVRNARNIAEANGFAYWLIFQTYSLDKLRPRGCCPFRQANKQSDYGNHYGSTHG
jgi:hypothetical protein